MKTNGQNRLTQKNARTGFPCDTDWNQYKANRDTCFPIVFMLDGQSSEIKRFALQKSEDLVEAFVVFGFPCCVDDPSAD